MKLEGKLELTWVGKNEEIKLEPRILVEDKSKSYGDPNTDNMLIHGDNLLALKALEKDFAGKIKCIYIDPPYNTGSAFEHYDDNLEHSIWLSLMKERLELLRVLLKDDGLIFIEIDDCEQAYLKILCDEIFGRNCFVSMLVIETGEVFGTKAAHLNKTFVKVKDYILVYKKTADANLNLVPLYTKTNESFDSHYSIYIDNETFDKMTLMEYLAKQTWIVELFKKYNLQFKINNISTMIDCDSKFKDYIYNNIAKNIYQDQPFNNLQIISNIEELPKYGNIYKYNDIFLFKTSSGTVRYYKSFKDAIHKTSDYNEAICRSTARGDLWKGYHLDMRNIDDEGSVKFKSSKKSERLIKDIFTTCTKENDIILDSFLGSGTTCAVAHKMNRRWIGIELGNHAYTHCKPRIDSIINNEDLTGITGSVNWQGGGGYKFYELAESLLVKNEKLPIYQINPNYTFEMMCEAICKIEGFDYKPEGLFHGKSSENRFIHITTEFVNAEYIKNLSKELSNKQSLLIYSTKFDNDLRLPDNIVVKKIPKDLLKKCKFESEVR